MEAEDVFAGLHIYAVILEHQFVVVVKPFTTCYVHNSQVEAQTHKFVQSLASDVRAADVDLLEVGQLASQTDDACIFEVRAPQEAHFSQEFALTKSHYSVVSDLTALGQRNNFEGPRA